MKGEQSDFILAHSSDTMVFVAFLEGDCNDRIDGYTTIAGKAEDEHKPRAGRSPDHG